MKAVKIVLILLIISSLIIWVRGGDGFDIRRVLPLVNDKGVAYQWGGVAAVGLLLWGLARLKRQAGRGGKGSAWSPRDESAIDSDD